MKNLKNKNCKKYGRPPYILNEKLFIKTLAKVKSGEINNLQAMEICNIKKTLYYKYKKMYDLQEDLSNGRS